MQIDAAREGSSTILRLGGRLDREWAEYLSTALEDLLRSGARSLVIDLASVTYISSAATDVLARWQQELAALRGEVRLTSISPALREMLAIAGWDARLDGSGAAAAGLPDLRQSSWQRPAIAVTSGQYQTSSALPEGTLSCRLYGHPDRVIREAVRPEDCETVSLTRDVFGLGLGAIGGPEQGHERLGELVTAMGCVAYFPTDGARLADYLVGAGPVPPRAVLAWGLICSGAFSKLVRFSSRAEAESVPLSELAGVCLDAAGGPAAGIVLAGEMAGLTGARLRRSPAGSDASPMRFDLPAVREWVSFAPERTHSLTTALIVGVVARAPQGPLAAHLRPLGLVGHLHGHFHAAVFSYRPLPQRTVELATLIAGLFTNHQLRDVLHLVWDDRGEAAVDESALLRGVAWVGPITHVA